MDCCLIRCVLFSHTQKQKSRTIRFSKNKNNHNHNNNNWNERRSEKKFLLYGFMLSFHWTVLWCDQRYGSLSCFSPWLQRTQKSFFSVYFKNGPKRFHYIYNGFVFSRRKSNYSLKFREIFFYLAFILCAALNQVQF